MKSIQTNLMRWVLDRSVQRGYWTLSRLLLRVLTVAFALSIGIASAQTVTVSPTGYITLATGGTVQFSATVSGSTNQNVKWSLPGNTGGSTTLGTITSGGLYTAPSTIPSSGVEVMATSQANQQSKGTQFVYILPAGPTISSVSPNPLSTGSTIVTINGNGFAQGALVKYNYNGTMIQTNPVTLSTGVITASVYVPNSPNTSFTVTNPGSMPSNLFVVPIKGGQTTYSLTVTNGTGTGNYPAGAVVSVTSNAPPAGQVFLNWSGSPVANATLASTTITMSASSAAVTANFTNGTTKYLLTVNNGTGGGNYTAGTVVPINATAPPVGQIFANWTGAVVASPNSASTTITMPAGPTTVTANNQIAAQVPFPVASHPRLWITQADLPRLQSWATSNNPVYSSMKSLLGQAVSKYQTKFFPGGVANPNYPDLGDTDGYDGELSEEVGFVLAFNSLIDPNLTNRITYAKYARNLIMYVMNQAALGPLASAPFRDPQFPTFNRANLTGAQWPLIVDWIYNAVDAQGNPILTSSDKATIRNVFLLWAQEASVAYSSQGFSPFPTGAMNSASLLLNSGKSPNRMASNNYFMGRMRLVSMMGLCIDPVDDPVIDPTKAPATLNNTLRSYILDATGAWLYQIYAMMGDPQTVASDYGLSGNGASFGLASGGLPPEGMLYGESFGFVLGGLLALETAGFNSTTLSGPQIKLIGAPVWDRYVKGYLSSLTPTAKVNPTAIYYGPIYQMASYGDLLRLYITPDNMRPIALLALLEQEQGQSTHLNAARWFSTTVEGTLAYNVSQSWSWGTADSILYYMLLDPGASPATDPRPTYPLNFFDPPAGRVLARSDWTPNATWFDYRASWESIYHQDGDGGQFEFFRKGEWLTKEMSNYDNNANGLTTYYHNTLGLKNWCANGTPSLQYFELTEWPSGSNWMLGSSAGDPTTINSFGPGYNYVSSDLTNLYNRPSSYPVGNALLDIKQATRSVVWLNNDYLVIYDRATSVHSGLFKSFNMCMAQQPTINGNTATEVMGDGQQLFVQTLLPANATLSSAYAAGNLNPQAELDPMAYVLTDMDPTLPTDTRFLHVLQGADAGAAMVPATYIQSASGTVFDGAIFGSMAVFFPQQANTSVVATTFNVPSTSTCLVVTGLTPGATYDVVSQTMANGKTILLTPSTTGSAADSAGLLKVGV